MNNRGGLNLGDEIRNIVQDAVNNMNFNRLNRDIKDVVNGALDEVRRSIAGNSANQQTWNSQSWKADDYQYSHDKFSQTWNFNNNQRGYQENKPVPKFNKITVPVGKVAGILFTVFGSIGSITSLIASIILAITGYKLGIRMMYDIITFLLLPGFIVSMALLLNGSRFRKRLKRFQRYTAQMHDLEYFMIKDFSSATGKSSKYIAKDLQKMIDMGMFPEGHIDEKKTCFMLNNEIYKQYLKLQENMKMREMEEQSKNKEEALRQEQDKKDKFNKKVTMDPEIRKAINEGREFVKEIRYANIEIPGEEISRKLDRLEEVTGKIFDYIESHPEKFPVIKKFAEYFLPTTLKLLDAYREFDYQPISGENISTAKKEIEDTMDTINLAFENLLDDLFQDAAMDVSTDISVLETMLAQEGLAQKNIK
ncbi:MAG: 5-bromo-4-chloroindolyl phosphate hydrolysis family protein [Sedimentibacter sp.]